MRRVARRVGRSLGLIPSAIYFSLVVLMLLGAWSTWAFMEAQQIEMRAADRLALSAQAIAGAVNAPSADDPRTHPAQAHAREAHVLSRLAAVGDLTAAQADAALSQSLDLVPRGTGSTG